jgi:hypothetical protein
MLWTQSRINRRIRIVSKIPLKGEMDRKVHTPKKKEKRHQIPPHKKKGGIL